MSAVDVHGLPEELRDQARKYRDSFGSADYPGGVASGLEQAADALEAALRQSGEAVAWRAEWDAARKTYWIQYHDETDPLPESFEDEPTRIIPLYTAPPATSGLVELVRREIEAAKRELDTVTATDDAQSDGIGCAENALDRALAAIAAIAGHDAGGGR